MIDFADATLTVAETKLIVITVLWVLLPLSAATFYGFRRKRRTAEVERIFTILHGDKLVPYREAYEDGSPGAHLFFAVVVASAVSVTGLMVLFFGAEIGLDKVPGAKLGNANFPEKGSRLVFGLAFFGAYLWGLQHIFRRFALNDLTPEVYYGLSIRMILAAIIAVILYNGYEALAGPAPGDGDSAGGITGNIWAALAFLIGMFPQRGLRWLTRRLPILSTEHNASVREAPLEMIEGIEVHDVLRLEEQGIDTCYDLAAADFIPLVIKTPYGARQLIDWILQAKLVVFFGEAVKDLRQRGIRTILDLQDMGINFDALSKETALTKSALERARKSIENPEIKRLSEAGEKLGKFWQNEDPPLQT